MRISERLEQARKQAQESRGAAAAAGGDGGAGGSEGESSDDEDVDEEDEEEQDADTSAEGARGGAAAPVADVLVGSAIGRCLEGVRRSFVGIAVRIELRAHWSRVFTVVHPEDLDLDSLNEAGMEDVTVEPEFKVDGPKLSQRQAVCNKTIPELQAALGGELCVVRDGDLPLDVEQCWEMYSQDRHDLRFHMREALVLHVLRARLVERLLQRLGRNS